jgi:hypothetical protein
VIRKLLLLGLLAWVVQRMLAAQGDPSERAVLGFADGSSVVLEPGAPGLDPILATARDALLP